MISNEWGKPSQQTKCLFKHRWSLNLLISEHQTLLVQFMFKKKKYILVYTDYVTKWVESKALYVANEQSNADFLFEQIFTYFGVPREIIIDQGTQFTSKLVKTITEQYQIRHQKSTPYHQLENGQVESTNKVIKAILTKTIQLHHKKWVDRLPEALWAYRTTSRNTIRHSSYELVYRK